MTVTVIDPAYLTVTEWCDFMVTNLEQFGNLPRLDDPEKWRDWGVELLNMPQLSGSIVPDPFQFDNWTAWAMRLNENLWAMP